MMYCLSKLLHKNQGLLLALNTKAGAFAKNLSDLSGLIPNARVQNQILLPTMNAHFGLNQQQVPPQGGSLSMMSSPGSQSLTCAASSGVSPPGIICQFFCHILVIKIFFKLVFDFFKNFLGTEVTGPSIVNGCIVNPVAVSSNIPAHVVAGIHANSNLNSFGNIILLFFLKNPNKNIYKLFEEKWLFFYKQARRL